MMDLIKYKWALRALFYKLKFGKIGWLSYIGKPIYMRGTKQVEIGSKVRIYPGLRIETHGENGKIIIHDNVSIGQNFHITSSDSVLEIGSNSTILGNVFITNIDHEYKEIGKPIFEQAFITKKTVIGENAFIGFGAAIQAGTILGKHCIVGTNAVVRGVFPDYSVIVGSPGRVVKRYNHQTEKWEKE
jgi:acetyltransferase-like isoleucine patch superfamily enzyme